MTLLSAEPGDITAGWLFVHACKPVLVPHLESAVAAVTRTTPLWQWCEQPAMAGHVRADIRWRGPVSYGARLASAMRMLPGVHAEVSSEPTASHPGMRYALVPQLGLWSAQMDALGQTLVGEEQLRAALSLPETEVRNALRDALGLEWDDVLEPLRASEGRQPVTLLRVV